MSPGPDHIREAAPPETTRAHAGAEVAAFLTPGGGLPSALAPDDRTPIVPVFTAPDHLRAAVRPAVERHGRGLTDVPTGDRL